MFTRPYPLTTHLLSEAVDCSQYRCYAKQTFNPEESDNSSRMTSYPFSRSIFTILIQRLHKSHIKSLQFVGVGGGSAAASTESVIPCLSEHQPNQGCQRVTHHHKVGGALVDASEEATDFLNQSGNNFF
jgi:hypothetical protein